MNRMNPDDGCRLAPNIEQNIVGGWSFVVSQRRQPERLR
jgi:hypothetical protein